MDLVFGPLRLLARHALCIAITCALWVSTHIFLTFKDKIPNPITQVDQIKESLIVKAEELHGVEERIRNITAEIHDWDRQISDRIKELEEQNTWWNFFRHPLRWYQRDLEDKALKIAQDRKKKLKAFLDGDIAEKAKVNEQITKLNQKKNYINSTWYGKTALVIKRHWLMGVLVGVSILVVPLLTRAIWWYMVAPFASKAKPVRLAGTLQKAGVNTPPMLKCSESERKLDLDVAPNESLFVRNACLQRYVGNTRKSTQLLWKWKKPVISVLAKLYELTRVDGGEEGATVSIYSGTDADRKLVSIELKNHPGLVFRPRHLVGVIHESGMLELETRWRLNYLHAWCTLQLRYIVLRGTGRVILWAMGGIEPVSPTSGKLDCVSQDSVAGFDTQLTYGVRRNETFWPYLRGKEPLFDDCFNGEGQYLISLAAEQEGGIVGVDSWFNRILTIVGKVFGF